MDQNPDASRIKLLVCDVDGVMTDGAIIYATGNVELKRFNIKDGLAVKLAGWSDLPIVWLTGRRCEPVARRAAELNVPLYQSAADKDAGLRRVVEEQGVELSEVAYIGDDLNDLPALRIAGFPVAVADAVAEVKAVACYVTEAPGGKGAVRELIELILRAQGRWEAAIERYLELSRGAANLAANPRLRTRE